MQPKDSKKELAIDKSKQLSLKIEEQSKARQMQKFNKLKQKELLSRSIDQEE